MAGGAGVDEVQQRARPQRRSVGAATPLLERHSVELVWVKGHAGHPENERCDQLAVAAANAAKI